MTTPESLFQEHNVFSAAYYGVSNSSTSMQEYHWAASGSQIPTQPSLNYTRKTWWESALSLYIAPFSHSPVPLNADQRRAAIQGIASDLQFIFSASNYWFAFLHVPSVLDTYKDPAKRERMQPSLLLALLAVSTFWQSSEFGKGREGRERSMQFCQAARCALEASLNSNAIDETLAQAAWVISSLIVSLQTSLPVC